MSFKDVGYLALNVFETTSLLGLNFSSRAPIYFTLIGDKVPPIARDNSEDALGTVGSVGVGAAAAEYDRSRRAVIFGKVHLTHNKLA